MSDSRTGVNGEVVIDPNEILGIERDTDPTEDGVSVLLWPGRWRIRGRSLAGTGGGGGGAVSSVAGRTGAVTLSSADLTDAASLATDAELTAGLDTKADASHAHGVIDLTATGTRDATTYLRGDNTWATPASGGGGPVALDASPNLALWVVSPTSSTMGGYSAAHRLFTSTLMPLAMPVYGLSVYCTTADTDATITLALYQGFSATNQVAQVTPPLAMPLSATGQVLSALPEPVTLSAGPLFIGYHTSGTAARVRAGTSAYPLLRPGQAPFDNRQVRFIDVNSPLPATLNIDKTTAPTSDSPPAVGLLAVAP